MNKDQIPFDFNQAPPEVPQMPELHEQDECGRCGNIIESNSPGCVECASKPEKIAYQEKLRKAQGGK